MNGAQIVWWILNIFALVYAFIKHGEWKDGKYNFFTTLIAFFIDYAIMKWGGFF